MKLGKIYFLFWIISSTLFSAEWDLPATDISENGANANSQQVAVGSSTAAVAVWLRSNGTNNIVQASVFDGSSFLTADDLSATGQRAVTPQVGVDFSTGTGVAVWNRSNGTFTIVQATTLAGTPAEPTAPTNFAGTVLRNQFLTQTDKINKLTWTASADATVVGYKIYQGAQLVAQTSSTGPFKVTLHNRVNPSYTYRLVSFNSSGVESEGVFLTL